jgi:hypothetical protein
MLHPSCVHVAVSTVNASWLARVIRKSPTDVWARPALPTLVSAGAFTSVTEIVRPATLEATAGNGTADSPPGAVGLPPQADNHVPATTAVAAPQAFAQNSLRL